MAFSPLCFSKGRFSKGRFSLETGRVSFFGRPRACEAQSEVGPGWGMKPE